MEFIKKGLFKRNNGIGSAITISKDINENIARLKNDFGDSSDLEVNYIKFPNNKDLVCASIYFTSLIDRSTISSLAQELSKLKHECRTAVSVMDFDVLMNYFSGVRASKEGYGYETLYDELLSGNTVFLVNGCNKFFTIFWRGKIEKDVAFSDYNQPPARERDIKNSCRYNQ